MGLLDEVFPKKDSGRVQPARTAQSKRTSEKSTKTAPEKSSSTPSTGNTFFDSLKRVQGALSPSSKAKSDPKRTQPLPEVPKRVKERDKERSRPKEKEKERRSWFRSPSRSSQKKEIKSSTSSLNTRGINQKFGQQEVRKRRPVSAFPEATNIVYKRGQTAKLDGQNLGDLSRASSFTNLDADPKNGKGARPKKTSSRERIDKLAGDGRKIDKKGITRNNNKLETEENQQYSIESHSEEELYHLRRQLQEMAQEKTNLALQLGEQKGQLNIMQKEIQKLKPFQEESNMQLEHLTEENTALRNRLRDVALSPLSDNEKRQLLFDSHRHHSSAPASIATNIIDDGNGGGTTCTTPDWDKHSSGNVSEVSVACLQDKINQMQETHYSTNEELQATVQELTDLQRQFADLQHENERLNEEKSLMFDSLCCQTERLNDSRSEIESLKQLLYQEKGDSEQFETAVEREQKLVDLLKSAQTEREGLMVKVEQLNNELQETKSGSIQKDEQIGNLRERVKTLECTLDAKHAEHKLLDQELAQAKDQCSGKQIEINRLTDLLDNARTKINELEQDRTLSDKSELDELLDNARKEKDSLESEVAHLKELLAIGKNEIEKLKEQVSVLQEECKVTRNNAKTTQSDLEYKCEKLVKDKTVLNEQLQSFQEALNELQVQSQCQLEDKRQLSTVLSETQRNLREAERKNVMLENELEEIKKVHAQENEEWEKFQDDLLTTVRVANDFKTETQLELQRIILENKAYLDREKQLKAEIEKLKGGSLKAADKENMDLLFKRPSKSRNKPKPAAALGGKSDRSQSLPQPVPVKRRENKPSKAKRLKTLSVEEEMLLSSLNNYHKDIDNTLPDEFLTEEQKVIRKLKIIYEDDFHKVKPVAPKPKDQLAISKPLLDSVLTNPKLMAILKNPRVKTVEDMASFEKEAPEIRRLIQDIDRSKKGKSVDLASPSKPEHRKRISLIGRSMSCNYVDEIDEREQHFRLYRSTETEDLTKAIPVNVNRESSSLVPSDSASNYKRYSDFSQVVNQEPNVYKENVNYATLERIARSIPANAPDCALTNEQKFARQLLKSLDERKETLRKWEKAKILHISAPTLESVLKNPKLKEIIYDSSMPEVRRKSEPLSPPAIHKNLKHSKSYDNIMFNFDDEANKTPVERESSTDSKSRTSLKSQLLKDELAQLTRTVITEYNQNDEATEIPVKTKRKNTKRLEYTNDEVDSLLYNDTLNKKEKIPLVAEEGKVDLLQEKIRKKTKASTKNQEIEPSPDAIPTSTAPTSIDETIKNFNEKLQTIHDLIKEDRSQEKTDAIVMPDLLLIANGGQSDEYDQETLLKLNRIGVTSPLSYTLGYKSVVEEIKKRFSCQDIEDLAEDNIEMRRRSIDLDKEMEDIIESYLNTRVSQLIKQSEGDSRPSEISACDAFDKKVSDIIDGASGSNNTSDSTEKHISPTKITFTDNSFYELKDGCVKNIRADDSIVEIIEAFLDDQRKVAERYIKLENNEVNISEKDKFTMDNQEVATFSKPLTIDDWELIRNCAEQRYSRPLSDLNEDDLKFVQDISKQYENDTNDTKVDTADNQEDTNDTKKDAIDNNEDANESQEDTNDNEEDTNDNKEGTNDSKVDANDNKEDANHNKENKGLYIRAEIAQVVEEQDEPDSNVEYRCNIEIDKKPEEETKKRSSALSNMSEKELELIEKITNEYMMEVRQELELSTQNTKDISVQNTEDVSSSPRTIGDASTGVGDSESLINTTSSSRSRVSLSDMIDKSKNITNIIDTSDTNVDTTIPARALHVILYRNNRPNSGEFVSSLTEEKSDKNMNDTNKDFRGKSSSQQRETRVKSFARHFELLSQQKQPQRARRRPDDAPPTVAKPTPSPRSKNQSTDPTVNVDSRPNVRNYEVARNMSEYEENFSVNVHRKLIEQPESTGAKRKTEVPGLHESHRLLRDENDSPSTDDDDDDDDAGGAEGAIKKSEKFLAGQMPMLSDEYLESTAQGSFSVIQVAGTAEKLDLRKQSNLTVEPSNLNLFNLDESAEETYIDIKRLSGNSYIRVVNADCCDNDSLELSDSKPKIVDFVPLDEATKPYYKNHNMPDYGTLEREKTYQILNAGQAEEVELTGDYSSSKKTCRDSEKVGVSKVTLSKKKSKDLFDTPDDVTSTESTVARLGVPEAEEDPRKVDEI
ncbi:unnamed protein product [Phyllotreta striolata]|uniref:Uncharacterized protein n=1 Tax=Phyllotreta striolata TaxID=444603 RepID=A0A9N9XSE9_PHYSR|nr:unnamed protein product [Phyllotreta striolata]